jgi:phosphatidylinositol-3-phosphatase
VALFATACDGGQRSAPSAATPTDTPSRASAASAAAAPSSVAPRAPGLRKVLVVVEENKSYDDIIGSPEAPYLNDLARRFGSATAYDAGYRAKCPSLASYVLLTSGSEHGICDDDPPGKHPLGGDNIFRQVAGSGREWRVYAQSMPRACARETVGTYLVKHNPAPYYTSERARCDTWDVPLGSRSDGALAKDVASGLPSLSFVIPDACDDMHGGHGCPDGHLVRRGDSWLSQWLPMIMAGPDYTQGKLAIMVTWDESSSDQDNHIATLVISPTTRRISDPTPQTHCTSLRTIEDLLHLPPLGCAAGVAPATARFHL